MTIKGGCQCGSVRWESSEAPITTRACWCRDCQYLGAGSGTVNACFRTATFAFTGKTQDFASAADSGSGSVLSAGHHCSAKPRCDRI